MAEETHTGYLDNDYLGDDYLEGTICTLIGMQVGFSYSATGMEVGEQTNSSDASGMSVNYVPQKHREHGEYLVDDYLGYADDYLAAKQCVFVGMQVEQEIPQSVGMQVTQILYNTCAFRILCDFASRGTTDLDGENWTSTNQATGDFSPNNLNTDIVEQVFRSSTTAVTLTVDTGVAQGIGIDTLSFQNHNLSDSAVVQMQGSDDNFVSAPNFTTNLFVTSEELYYIAPGLPNAAETNRYWRFIIQDTNNVDGFIQLGAILFGNAQIFAKNAELGCPRDPIRKFKRHFKDEVQTEGFTNVMNDRTTKQVLSVNFQDMLVEGENKVGTNFNIINDYICDARTSLKCLIIPQPGCVVSGVDTPDPERAKRYGIFAKLSKMPQLSFTTFDCETTYATVALDWDESL